MRITSHNLQPILDFVGCARLTAFSFLIGSSLSGCVPSKLHDSVPSEKSAKAEDNAAATSSSDREGNPQAIGVRVDSMQPFSISDFERSRGACVFFVGTDCPISNAYAPEIGRIVTEFEKHGITFYFIYAIRDLEPNEAAEHAKSFGLRGQVVLDNKLGLAKALGATRMPEVLLLPTQGEAVYQGRIDDRYPALGAKRREHPQTHDLRDALKAFVAGEPIVNNRTDAVGCYLDLPK